MKLNLCLATEPDRSIEGVIGIYSMLWSNQIGVVLLDRSDTFLEYNPDTKRFQYEGVWYDFFNVVE